MIELDNGFVKIENSDLFNISHFNTNAEAASAVAGRVTAAEGNISDIQTALDTKVDTSTYTAGMATKVNSSTYTSGMATKVDKVDGKGLSTEDYTTTEKNKLAGIESGANNYSLPTASSSTKGGVKVGSGFSMSSDTLNLTFAQLDTIFASVKLNGTALNAADYWMQQGAFCIGAPYPGNAVVTLSAFFGFNDERDISSGSVLEFVAAQATWASCVFAGAALGGSSANNLEICGSATVEMLSGVTVKLSKTVKGVLVQATGIGYYKA